MKEKAKNLLYLLGTVGWYNLWISLMLTILIKTGKDATEDIKNDLKKL